MSTELLLDSSVQGNVTQFKFVYLSQGFFSQFFSTLIHFLKKSQLYIIFSHYPNKFFDSVITRSSSLSIQLL